MVSHLSLPHPHRDAHRRLVIELVPEEGGYGSEVAGFLAKVALSQRPAFSHDIGINEPTKPFVSHSDDKEREGEQRGQNS